MENDKDTIGQLFQTELGEYTEPLEPGEWDGLHIQLAKQNFFHFNPIQFNVYYAGMVIFCFITCIFVGTHYTYTQFFKDKGSMSEAMKTNETERLPTDKTVQMERSELIQSIETPKKEEVGFQPTKEIKSNKRKMAVVKDSSKTALQKLNILDSSAIQMVIPSIEPVVTKPDTLKKKPKRIVYITKQDTIVQFDTVQAPKKKKKWFK